MIVSIVGARPQFIKASVVSKAFAQADIEEKIIHTGQHYENKLSDVFWHELGIPAVSINLQVGSGMHGKQTGTMLEKLEACFVAIGLSKIKGVVLYGDTNSTLAGALAASKLNLKVIHIEAGLRSFNREMPEEINRILTDHVSDILFCPSENAVNLLAKEGISKNVYISGDVMYDAVAKFGAIADSKVKLNDIIPFNSGKYNLLTIHRPSNTDKEENLFKILSAIEKIETPCVWPLHPRNRKTLSILEKPKNLLVTEPFSYFEMLTAVKNSNKIFTDSGGLQKEAYWMKKPCITLRDETEWIETKQNNWNILTGNDEQKILQAYSVEVNIKTWTPQYGDASASNFIAAKIKEILY